MSGKLKRPTVLAVHLRDDGVMGGCEQYRIRIPFEEIREKVPGAVVDWAPIGQVREWAGEADRKIMPTDYDMWVMPRHRPLPYGIEGTIKFSDIPVDIRNQISGLGIELEGKAHLLDMVKLARKKQRIVLEYDDDHWGSRDIGYHEHVDLAKDLLGLADAVTVTTPYMRKLVQKYARSVPIYILPNCVNFAEWQGWDRWNRWPEDHVVLGLTGSITHYEDWRVLSDVMPRVMKEQGNVALLLQGYVPDYLESLVRQFPHRVYADNVFRDYAQYPGIVRQADIVLCPVEPDDPFNHAKSAIKAVEGMASGRMLPNGRKGGAAIIASPLNYYGKVVGWGNKRGIIAEHTPEAWYKAITYLVENQQKRHLYQVRGRKWAYANRSIERQWRLWWDAYLEIYRRNRK